MKSYYELNKEERKTYQRNYYQKNKTAIHKKRKETQYHKEYQKNYYERNKEKLQAYQRDYARRKRNAG